MNTRTLIPRAALTGLAVPLLLAGLSLPGGTAQAQQTTITGGEFRDSTIVDDTLNRRGRIELGLSLAGAVSFNSTSPDDGEGSRQTSAYLVPSLVAGYMVTDHIEVRLSLGTQWVRAGIGDSLSQDTFSGVFAAQGLYQRDFTLGLAGYAGIGAGGYYGWRDVPTGNPDGSRARYVNGGGLGQVLLGLMAQPGPRLLLRGGFRLDLLVGQETPESEVFGGARSTLNVHGLAELGIGWRLR